MTADEIAERAARAVCRAHGVKREDKSERWTAALGWAMGGDIGYEQAQREVVAAALKIDREQREALPEPVTRQIAADHLEDALLFHPQGGQMSDWTDTVVYDEETETVTRYAYSHADQELRALRYTR